MGGLPERADSVGTRFTRVTGETGLENSQDVSTRKNTQM